MSTKEDMREAVRRKYDQIARQSSQQKGCGCCGSEETVEYSTFNDDYATHDGYVAEADLRLGCGIPTDFAEIKSGDTVVDLGSGAGNDVFVARSIVGETGKVIGIDMVESMIEKANQNKQKLGYKNIEFRLGDIENLPLKDNSTDVVVSNCVLNLVPDKRKAYEEIYRILKPGAHFCISDVVVKGELPVALKESAEMYAGCVSGALAQDDYLDTIKAAGFKDIKIKKSKTIWLPDELLKEHLTEQEFTNFRKANTGIVSITVVGYKT